MSKKLFLILVVALAAWIHVDAQPIMSYDFASSLGTYTEITDGTVLTTVIDDSENGIEFDNNVWVATEATNKTVTANGFEIGFDFVYNNQKMNHFAISSHLSVILGKGEMTVNPDRSRYYFMDNDEGAQENVIGASPNIGVYGKADTEISYKLLGEAPNRTLVVQFKNVYVGLDWWGELTAPVNYQVRLNETTNTINMVFDGWLDSIADNSKDVRVGLKGNNGDVHMRAYDWNLDVQDWQNTVKSTEDESLTWDKDCKLVDGLTYTFTPCADCTAPTVQPTNIQVAITTDIIKGSFTPVEVADHYLVLLSTEALSTLPTDGKFYKTGDSIASAVVLGYYTDTLFSNLDEYEEIVIAIKPETKYYVTVFAANSYCMYGPKYNTTNPLVKEVTSLPAAPTSVEIVNTNTTSIEVSATANASGHDVVIAYTAVANTNEYGTYLGSGLFGTPVGNVAVGDELEGGGKVIYIGKEKTAVKVENLAPNKVYYFAAWSKDANGNYSSLFAGVDVITDGVLPYEFLAEEMFAGNSCGREMDGVSVDKTTLGFYFGPALVGTEYTLTTQWIRPEQGVVRLVFDMNMYIWGRVGSNAYNEWTDDEKLLFEYTTDGTEWTTFATIDKTNAPQYAKFDEYVTRNVLFEKKDDKPIKIRIHWIPGTPQVRFYMKGFRIEQKKDCDYPINLKATDVVGDQATLTWEQQGTETQWVINWKLQSDSIWTEILADSRSYKLSGLPGRSVIEARVAAKCSAESQSDWSNVVSFTSGYVLPFTELFNEASLPAGWELKEGALTDSTVFTEGVNWEWFSTVRMKTLMLNPASPLDSWVLFPTVNFPDTAVNYNLNFTITNAMQEEGGDEVIKIVVSKDGGKTFKASDVVYTVANADLPGDGDTKTYATTLKGLEGSVRIGLLVSGTTGAKTLMLDEVSITESCPNDVVVKAEEILGTSATISWTGTIDEGKEWMVFIRKAGETTKEYKNTVDTFMVFNDLENRTAYEVGVTKACATDDVARPVIFKFTTAANDPCFPVETITAKSTALDVTLEWSGEAYAYNLRYRQATATDWTEVKEIKANTYTITNLTPETEYVYQLQTLCSLAEGDYSEWTIEATITTLVETCFAPTNIVVVPAHNKATITWEGTADKYAVEYRLATAEEWTVVEVAGANTVVISDLTPETAYQLRMRSVCSETDASRYSEIVLFSTVAIPECVAPTNLRVENVTTNSATLLWDADDINLSWVINWRASAETSWTEVVDLDKTTYNLTELEANTPYIWRVKATCDEGRQSGWSEQNKFTTIEYVAVDNIHLSDLNVYAKSGVINIINSQAIFINTISIYTINGALVGVFDVNTADNVIIPTNITDNVVLLSIQCGNQTSVVKVAIK